MLCWTNVKVIAMVLFGKAVLASTMMHDNYFMVQARKRNPHPLPHHCSPVLDGCGLSLFSAILADRLRPPRRAFFRTRRAAQYLLVFFNIILIGYKLSLTDGSSFTSNNRISHVTFYANTSSSNGPLRPTEICWFLSHKIDRKSKHLDAWFALGKNH